MGDYDEITLGRRVEFVTWIRVMDEIISNRFTGEKNKRSKYEEILCRKKRLNKRKFADGF